ncbi:hypothetical protein ACLBXM_19895 [Xanthobacteraceae bacterium A53D]
MARRNILFKQADVMRAVKGVTSAGVAVGRVDVDQEGRISVIAVEASAPASAASPLDKWEMNRAARKA